MEKCCGGAVNAYECIATTLSQVSQLKLSLLLKDCRCRDNAFLAAPVKIFMNFEFVSRIRCNKVEIPYILHQLLPL